MNIRLAQDILKNNCNRIPDKTALICEGKRISYADLDTNSDVLATALADQGIQPGERVLIYLMNSIESVISIFGVLKAGAVFCNVDYANTEESLLSIALDSGATAIITHAAVSGTALSVMKNASSLRCAFLTGALTEALPEHCYSYDAILQEGTRRKLNISVICSDLAYLLYTSGSTGKPKGVMTTHRASLFTIGSGVERFGLQETDVHALPLPLSFAPGLNQFLQIFRVGGTVILEKSFAFPGVVLKRMVQEGATGMGCVPTILTMLSKMDLSKYDFSGLRYLVSSGAALPVNVIEFFRGRYPELKIFSMYGMAEASFALCLDPGEIDHYPNSVGRPFPGTDAWLVDEQGNKLCNGSMGELILRGGHVRSGYWGDAEGSARRFVPGGLPGELLCRTGDIFRTDEEGRFYFTSRGDEIIKSGAKKIAPKEIESALYRLDGVLEAAVIGIPDAVLGTAIKAFVVLTDKQQDVITVEDILTHCARTVESFKVPKIVEIVNSLPKTAGGKIKKTALQ